MALTTCPDCGKKVSTLATFCPNCGRPMKSELPANEPDIIAEIAKGERVVCPDESCTGTIRTNGKCRTCGKHYSWIKDEERPSQLKCPECGSTQITAQKSGFGLGKAAVGGLLLGPVGLLGGVIGSGKIKVTCVSCGHSWRAGGEFKLKRTS